MKLNIQTDCENLPKKELIKNLTISFASYDFPQITKHLDKNVKWTLVGDKPILGRDAFMSALKEMSHNKVRELTIHSIVSHGNEATVNGEMILEDESQVGFSDFYEFDSAYNTLVKSIVSYVIPLNKNED